MKNFRLLLILNLLTFSAFAITDEQLAQECFDVGQQKIIKQAIAFECSINKSETEITEIDNRWYNPSKYLWFYAPGDCNDGKGITKMVQYFKGNCF